jgi:hypothetical protein
MSIFELAVVIAVVWILLSLLTAMFWHLLMSPLPHPDDLADAEPVERADVSKGKAANRHRDAA